MSTLDRESSTSGAILELLDRAAQGLDSAEWPWFHWGEDGRCEYFALRLIVVTDPEEAGSWGVVFERLQGSPPDALQIVRFAYGPHAQGGRAGEYSVPLRFDISAGRDEGHVFHGSTAVTDYGEFPLDESLFEKYNLLPGFHTEEGSLSQRVTAIRAFLEANPGVLWPSPEGALSAAGLPNGEILLVSEEFEHAAGTAVAPGVQEKPWHILPSQSQTFQSLAEAIIEGDPSLFYPGENNLDWRLHAVFLENCPLPWQQHRVSTQSGFLDAALREACVTPDERGLMPLSEARAILSKFPRFIRGNGQYIQGVWVWEMDRAWAALLSLKDGDEFYRYATALEWVDEPRDADKNTALAERYGDAVLPVIRAMEHSEGILSNFPRILKPVLLYLNTPAVFHYLWTLAGFDDSLAEDAQAGRKEPADQANVLWVSWMEKHPAVGYKELAELALSNEPDAMAILQEWAAAQPESVYALLVSGLGEASARHIFNTIGLPATLSSSHILSLLDTACLAAVNDSTQWPLFITGEGLSREYHGMRLIGARAKRGEDWMIVLERVEGHGPALTIARYVYTGHGISGWQPDHSQPLAERFQRALEEHGHQLEGFDERAYDLIEDPDSTVDLQQVRTEVHDIRAWLYDFPNDVFKDPTIVLARLGCLEADLIAVALAFEHAEGPQGEGPLPSESMAYRTLAHAIVERSGALFSPGEDTTDFHFYVVSEEVA